MSLSEVLQLDAKYRVTGVTDDLYTLDEVDPTKSWNFSRPTLITPEIMENNKSFTSNTQSVYATLYERVPFLRDVLLDNIIIAGGYVSSCLLETKNNYAAEEKDIDMFVYGLSQKDAANRVKQLVTNLVEAYRAMIKSQKESSRADVNRYHSYPYAHFSPKQVYVVRSPRVINVHIGDKWKFQIILRLYNTMSEVLHGFDLGSCAVGLADQKVWFTSLSRFCYENRVNIFDGARRSTTYEYRLAKYFNRGFAIVLPQLDISKLPRKNLKWGKTEIAEMPYWTFSYTKISDNRIWVSEFLALGKDKVDEILSRDVSDSADGVSKRRHKVSDYGDVDEDGYASFYANLRTLLWEGPSTGEFYCYGEGDYYQRAFDTTPYISEKGVLRHYDQMRSGIWKDGEFRFRTIENWFPLTTLQEVAAELFKKDAQPLACLDALFTEHKQFAIDLLREIPPQVMNWKTADPGSQLVGSFNPIIEDDKIWYGPYFLNSQA